jgi:hypothetical protein
MVVDDKNRGILLQPRFEFTMCRLLLILFVMTSSAAAAEATGVYASDLAAVYGGYQRLLAMKEACDKAVPASSVANGKAFTAWRTQHRVLVQELQSRVTAMIRLASKDEKEYARNLGKYEGAILQERLEYRDSLLGLGAAELREQCQRMPETLRSPAADLAQAYAAELETVRKRKP